MALFWHDRARLRPRAGTASFAVPLREDGHAQARAHACAALGYLVFGDRAIRADLVEATHAVLTGQVGQVEGAKADPATLASRLGVPARQAESLAQAILDDA